MNTTYLTAHSYRNTFTGAKPKKQVNWKHKSLSPIEITSGFIYAACSGLQQWDMHRSHSYNQISRWAMSLMIMEFSFYESTFFHCSSVLIWLGLNQVRSGWLYPVADGRWGSLMNPQFSIISQGPALPLRHSITLLSVKSSISDSHNFLGLPLSLNQLLSTLLCMMSNARVQFFLVTCPNRG